MQRYNIFIKKNSHYPKNVSYSQIDLQMPNRILTDFFMELEMLVPKFMQKSKKLRKAKIFLKNNKQEVSCSIRYQNAEYSHNN